MGEAATWELTLDYLGTCTCDVVCPCLIGQLKPTHDYCFDLFTFHVRDGRYGEVDLSGRRIVNAYQMDGSPFNGNWKVVLYLDEQTSQEQQDALTEIFTGKAGGPWGVLASFVGSLMAVKRVPISFDGLDGRSPTLRVGDLGLLSSDAIVGGDGENTVRLHNGLFPPGASLHMARTTSRFADPEFGWDWTLGHTEYTTGLRYTSEWPAG